MRYRRVFIPGASYFFTLATYERSPIFSDPTAIDLYRRAVYRVQTAWPFTLEAQVILPDRVHLLCTLPEGDTDYPTRVRLIKAAFTRSFLGHRERPGERSGSRVARGEQAVWQRRRKVAIEWGTWRSGRSGGASGSVTGASTPASL